MNQAIQPTSPARGGRPKKVDFSLPDNRLADAHTLINVTDDAKRINFVFHSDSGEVVVTFKPSKSDFAGLMDAIRNESLTVGGHSYPLRGAVREAMHASVVACHYRSI